MTLTQFETDALAGLCTQEQLELLDSIDTLRSQGISHYVSLPQIIVCGDQSSGKSSVLEAISGVSFPVKSSLCTRFPTELVLRKNSQVGVRVSIVPYQSRSEVEQSSLGRFSEQLDGFDGLPALIENAKAAMGISTHGKAFSNDLLRVEVSGPDRPHLTIVDLPGLIHSETRQQSAADVQLVQEVVQSYMREPRSIILAVVSAKNDFANQIVLRLARDADSTGTRTLGVISKPDMLVPGSESEASFVSLAKNQEVEFRLGWHVLRNTDSDKGQWSLADRNAQERDFFAQGIWEELSRSLVGVETLRNRLSSLLLGQISNELPSLIEEINSKITVCQQELTKLGNPRSTIDEQRSYLLQISQGFQSIVKAAVDGTYNEPFFGDATTDAGCQKRIRAVIQNLNEDFTKDIFKSGHLYHLVDQSQEPLSSHQISISRSNYVQNIETLLKKTRGRELPGTFNPMIVKDLFQEQCTPWKNIAQNHVAAAWAAAQSFLQLAVDHVADSATSKSLFQKVILPALTTQRQNLERACNDFLMPHLQGHPITYNHSFTETLQKTRADLQKEALRKALQSHFKVETLTTSHAVDYGINLQGLFNSLLKTIPSMTCFASEEALDCMLAYYQIKVALKRFVDDIATEVVEVKLLSALTGLFDPMTAFQMPIDLVNQIAGESKESQGLREQLNRKLWILNQGSNTCRRFAGTRGIGKAINPIFSFILTDCKIQILIR
ncbi:hypothetical protein N7468_010463 [Penicillium chermesinum]|uniref:Uncharacterized protein n=1 Tax=Penicillium chermesinum TaxID=63820 RepID=A0A9W9N7P9_9EURO|nr:uncharacterized protein N7468_010463 [Penicillium chermesinum]KAJ5214784.1 hypothetical protein N7468_010463 [Penicillium chermesinum]